MPSCNIDGIEISFTERGSGPALVLLHGFPLDNRVWDAAAALLGQRFRVITPDLRGFGESKCESPFTIESLADDVHQFVLAVDATPCILGGLSMGGYVALAHAENYPADLNGLALIDTRCAADTAEGKQARQRMIDLVRAEGSCAIADQMFPKMIAAESVGPPAAIRLRPIMEACPPLTVEHALAAMRDRKDYTALLPTLGMPVLVVVGEKDEIASPEVAKAMHEAVRGSTLVVIPGAGHMAPLEKPVEFAEAVVQWLG